MKIAIMGTCGVPAAYGGFETFVEGSCEGRPSAGPGGVYQMS